jgi:hypothetical protein
MGDDYVPSAVLILRHFLKQLDEQPVVGESCGRSKVIAICRSLVIHQTRLSPSADAEQGAINAAILRDMNLGARRIEQDGLAAVCDDPSHSEVTLPPKTARTWSADATAAAHLRVYAL